MFKLTFKGQAIILASILIFISLFRAAYCNDLSFKLKGRILLQVESKGEAWYVNPIDEKKYFLGKPFDAFNLMRQFGLGVSDKNLNLIPIGLINQSDRDTDKDGLIDLLEDAIGSDANNVDSDGDGYSDQTEIKYWHSLTGTEKKQINQKLISKLKGKILLQVEGKGEAWYVYPEDGKRYFLGRPTHALEIMKNLGLGITNKNLEQIPESNIIQTEKNDCEKKHFKMAFVLAGKDESEITSERIDKLTLIKNSFSEKFFEATSKLAIMDTSYKTVALIDDSNYGNKNYIAINQITKKFYENNPDDFDFITIYTAFKTEQTQNHIIVKNNILGIGLPIINNSFLYESNNKLLGINHMGFIDEYSTDSLLGYNGLLHETGHQTCCYAGDDFGEKTDGNLEIIQQSMHFYRGLESPFDNPTPMDSDKWEQNDDGTYRRSEFNPNKLEKYHPFQLYFMGILDKEEYDKKYKIYNAGSAPNFNFKNATIYKEQIDISDIVKVEGERRCQILN